MDLWLDIRGIATALAPFAELQLTDRTVLLARERRAVRQRRPADELDARRSGQRLSKAGLV